LNPVVEAFVNGSLEDGESLLLIAKAACTVLSGPNTRGGQSIWYTVAGEAASRIASSTDDGRYVDFLACAGILNDFGDEDAVHALLSVALTLCRRASNESFSGAGSDTLRRMEDVIRALSLVHDYALINCPERILVSLVSIGLLTETASQVLLRADEGLGEALETLSAKLARDARMRRNHVKSRDELIDGKDVHVLRIGRPLLHPSWYVGDGLLLPPRDALYSSVAYCRDVLDVCLKSGNSPANADGPVELHRFLGERGAHAVALRIVCVYTSMALSAGRLPSSFDGSTIGDYLLQTQRNTLKCLAERSLGGSGSGITSVTIDSQLAVTFLLSLPLKVAFKVRSFLCMMNVLRHESHDQTIMPLFPCSGLSSVATDSHNKTRFFKGYHLVQYWSGGWRRRNGLEKTICACETVLSTLISCQVVESLETLPSRLRP
jgi:hypothetical protein